MTEAPSDGDQDAFHPRDLPGWAKVVALVGVAVVAFPVLFLAVGLTFTVVGIPGLLTPVVTLLAWTGLLGLTWRELSTVDRGPEQVPERSRPAPEPVDLGELGRDDPD